MKIIQHGIPETVRTLKTFRYPNCGCVFEADKTEYKSGSHYNETYYYCQCPECEKQATVSES